MQEDNIFPLHLTILSKFPMMSTQKMRNPKVGYVRKDQARRTSYLHVDNCSSDYINLQPGPLKATLPLDLSVSGCRYWTEPLAILLPRRPSHKASGLLLGSLVRRVVSWAYSSPSESSPSPTLTRGFSVQNAMTNSE